MPEPAGTTSAVSPAPTAAPAPVPAGTPAPVAAAPSPAPAAAIPTVGDIPIINPTPEPPPASPTPPPVTPGTPAEGGLAPRAGETAEAYAVRLKEAGVEVQRTADAQRAMHSATAKAADLDRKLKTILGHPVVGPEAARVVAPLGTPAPVTHVPPVAAPAPSPAPPAPTAPQGLDGAIQALYAEYSNASLSEPQAFEKLVKGAVELGAAEALRRIGADPGIRDQIYGYVTGRAQNAVKVEAAVKEIEGFWTESAPHVPAELLWSYSEHAARAHPNDVPKQALFCLEQALTAMEKVSAHLARTQQTTDANRRGQEATLPGGGGTPPVITTPGKFPSLVDQMRAARASQPGA